MPYRVAAALLLAVAVALPAASDSKWSWGHRLELRGDYRYSDHEKFPLPFLAPPDFPEPGETKIFLETPDPGHKVELNAVELQLDLSYGDFFAARAKVHGEGLHRRNPTSTDRQFDVDELFVRFGPNPAILDRPSGTSFFLQAGKFPKMERQPVRLLESYGLAATTFNRFEDLQVLGGGSIGRNFYWRVQMANGNPLFFRDPNALAGDNGTSERVPPHPDPDIKSGFPIFYNAETEGLAFSTDHVQIGEALGYRWQRADQTLGFDAIIFHYRRDLADHADLTGTFYDGDLDLLNGAFDLGGLPITSDRTKEEYGARVYGEWHSATAIAQFTKQRVAGLQREAWELETGYQFAVNLGPVESIQPAARLSGITNRFRGIGAIYPAPSVWWQWAKIDAGLRVGLKKGFDVTLEYSKHNVGSSRKLNLKEALVTIRWRA